MPDATEVAVTLLASALADKGSAGLCVLDRYKVSTADEHTCHSRALPDYPLSLGASPDPAIPYSAVSTSLRMPTEATTASESRMEGALRDIDIAGQVVAGSQGLDPAIIRHVCSRFRILIVGPANAGKTTLIKKFCQSDEEAVVRNAQGQTVSSSTLNPSAQRGLHVINHEITYQSNPSFVFHDSMGFESGSTVESNIMLEFIHQRSGELSLADRLHAIWFCIPAGQDRVLGEPELELFKHNTFGIPVIVIFTKWDVQIQKANNLLRHQGRTRLQAKEEAPGYAETCFAPQLQDILHTPYPPRAIVYLRDMHKPEGNCSQLSRVTAEVLDDAAVKRFFISRQTVADKLAAEHAVREILSLKPISKKGDIDVEALMTQGIIYFPFAYCDIIGYYSDHRYEVVGYSSVIGNSIKSLCQSLSIKDATVNQHSLPFVIITAELLLAGCCSIYATHVEVAHRAAHVLAVLRGQGRLEGMHTEIKQAWEKRENWVKVLKSRRDKSEEQLKEVALRITELSWKYRMNHSL